MNAGGITEFDLLALTSLAPREVAKGRRSAGKDQAKVWQQRGCPGYSPWSRNNAEQAGGPRTGLATKKPRRYAGHLRTDVRQIISHSQKPVFSLRGN